MKTDNRTIIKWLWECSNVGNGEQCQKCPFRNLDCTQDCSSQLMKDAAEALEKATDGYLDHPKLNISITENVGFRLLVSAKGLDLDVFVEDKNQKGVSDLRRRQINEEYRRK